MSALQRIEKEPVCCYCSEPSNSCDCGEERQGGYSWLVCPDCRQVQCRCEWVEMPEFKRKPVQRMQMSLFHEEVA
jgi:hypothetical protein